MARLSINIHVIDHHPESRQSIRRLLAEAGLHAQVTQEFGHYDEALRGVKNETPDLMIVEIGIRNGNGMEFIRKMRLHYPNVRILAFTHQDEALYAERALRVGAHGYLMKNASAQTFQQAVRAVLCGELFVSPAIEEKILRGIAGTEETDERDPEKVLSNRELEIFVKIGEGTSSREIAEQLALSIKTVETHRAHIKRKLNIRSARDLLQQAREWVEHTYA